MMLINKIKPIYQTTNNSQRNNSFNQKNKTNKTKETKTSFKDVLNDLQNNNSK